MLDYAAEGFTMPGSDETRIIRFGVFEVDLQTGELRRNGFQIRLQEQPFQVLATLLQRHGEFSHPGRVAPCAVAGGHVCRFRP